jgi:hypothetical protein
MGSKKQRLMGAVQDIGNKKRKNVCILNFF